MAEKSISLDILDEDYDVVDNDFCSWEILDSYHDSDSDDFSFPDATDDVTSEIQVISQYLGSLGSPGSPSSSDDDASLVSQSPPDHRYLVVDEDEVIPQVVVTGQDLGFVSFPLPVDDVTPESDHHEKIVVGFGAVMYDDDSEGKYGYQEEEEEDENIEDYEPANNDLYLYDDELVPIGVSNKLEKQRIRKSGKKGGYGKKKNSKKMPHHSNRAGCIYGKHGLGVQHLMI